MAVERSSSAGFRWSDRWAVAKRVWKSLGEANLSLVSAGVAFYAMLALFPAIGALTSIYGLLADPSDLPVIVDQLRDVAPDEAVDLIEGQLTAIASADSGGLGLATLLGLLIAIWSSKAGVSALMQGLTIAYGDDAGRGFFMGHLLSYGLTLLLLVLAVVALAALVVTPAILALLGVSGGSLIWLLRWVIGLGAVMIAFGALYRYGPSRKRRRSPWFSYGALLATGLWLAVSGAFSVYVAQFSSYNETYGSLGAVIALLMWFFLSAFVVLLGGSLNAEVSEQEDVVERRLAEIETSSPRP